MTKAIIPIRLKKLLDAQRDKLPLKKTMFVMLYEYVLMRTNSYHKVHNYQRDFEGLVFLKASKWAKKFGVGNKTIYRMIKELLKADLIEKVELKSRNRTYYKYRLSNTPIEKMEIIEIENIDEIVGMETNVEKRIVKGVKELKIDMNKAVPFLEKKISKLKNKINEYLRKIEPEIYSMRQINSHKRDQTKQTPPKDTYSYKGRESTLNDPFIPLSLFENPRIVGVIEYTKFFVDSSFYLNIHTSWLNFKISVYRRENNIGLKVLSNPNRYISAYEKKMIDLRHDVGSLLYSVNSCYNFFNHKYSISRSDSNRRIRHNVIEMPKDIRQFLYHPDFDILDLDIANSQPSILIGMMRNMGVDFEDSLMEDVQHGRFYGQLQVASELGHIEYGDLKIACLRFLYTSPKTNMQELINNTPNVAKGFKRLYTKAFEWIVQRKRMFDEVDRKNNKPLKGNRSFNLEVQRAESHWMLDKVLRRLFHNNKKMWAIPMHDGMLIMASKKDRGVQIMEEEFEKLYGFTPLIRVKRLKK